MIEVAEKSILWLEVQDPGQANPRLDAGAGHQRLQGGRVPHRRAQRAVRAFPENDPVFDPPISTFEPTKKEANVPNINTIPGEDVFYMDCRILPSVPVEDVEAKIRRCRAGIEASSGSRSR